MRLASYFGLQVWETKLAPPLNLGKLVRTQFSQSWDSIVVKFDWICWFVEEGIADGVSTQAWSKGMWSGLLASLSTDVLYTARHNPRVGLQNLV